MVASGTKWIRVPVSLFPRAARSDARSSCSLPVGYLRRGSEIDLAGTGSERRRSPAEGSRAPVPLLVPCEQLGEAFLALGEGRRRFPLGKLHLVDITVPVNPGEEPVRECVDDRDTDAVETPRDLVRLLIELAACMEYQSERLRVRSSCSSPSCRPESPGRYPRP